MEQTQFSTIIQGFQLQISIKDYYYLFLHAQHLQDNRQFYLELHDDIVTQVTNSIFTEAQWMAQGLKDAANNISPKFKLSLDNNGRLTYSDRTYQKERSFSLNLIEETITESLQRKVKTLEEELERVKAQHKEEMTNMRGKYQEKIAKLKQEKEKNSKSEEKSSRPIMNQFAPGQICFRRDTPSAGLYEFSDDDKTVRLVGWDQHRALRCYPKVPETGKHTFALKVNEIGRFIGFGITSRESGEIYQGDQGNYFYFIGNGMLLTKEFETSDKIEGAGGEDSIVEMTVDMDARALMFCVDGKQVRSCKLKEGEEEYIVFVDFASQEDSVTLF